MKQIFNLLAILLVVLCCSQSHAAILVFTGTGTSSAYTTEPTLESARTALGVANKTVVVTSALTQVQSNISGAWPADRVLKIEKGGSIANSTAFAINGAFEAGIYQVFTGSGTVTFGFQSVAQAYPQWWQDNTTPGKTDMSRALNSAVASSATKIAINGIMAVHNVAVTTTPGVIFQGTGAGRWRGEGAKSRLIFNGSSGEYIVNITDSVGTKFRDLMLDGNNRVGGGVWLKKAAGDAEIHFTQFENVNFIYCTDGIKIGGNSGGITNFTELNGDNVAFYRCDYPVRVLDNNTEEMLFKNSFFIESYNYHFYATAQAALALEHVYLGGLNAGAGAAVGGPITIQWKDVWSELGSFMVANILDTGGSQASSMIDCHFTDPGESGITINWQTGAPLVLIDTTMGGRINFDSRRSNVSIVQQGLVFKPAPAGLTTKVGTSEIPRIGGTYTGSTATFTVEIVAPGIVGTATVKWKKSSKSFSPTITTRKQIPLGEGLLIQFMPGVTYNAGDQWTFVAQPCGIVESNGYFIGGNSETKSMPFVGTGDVWQTMAKLIATNVDGYYGGYAEVVVGGFASNIGQFSGVLRFRYDKQSGAHGYAITSLENSIPANLAIQAIDAGDNMSILIQTKNTLGTYNGSIVVRNNFGTDNHISGVNLYGINIVEP